MALGHARVRGTLRNRLSHLLRAEGGCVTARRRRRARARPTRRREMLLPAEVGDYTDFYASVFHATNVGKMLRPDNPLFPNYKWVPIGYHGRASSLVVSGTPIAPPAGPDRARRERRARASARAAPLDYELEVGGLRGAGQPARPAGPARARPEAGSSASCLLNDWSARDLQKWEYQPLGPFLAKSFATSISPWVVTLEALAPFRVPGLRQGPRATRSRCRT